MKDRAERRIHDYGWAVVNVPLALIGVALLPLLHHVEDSSAPAWFAAAAAIARTALDYAWNWYFYFPSVEARNGL